jgi:hypothetical protein
MREVQEELNATPTGVQQCGELTFQFADGLSILVYIFTATDCEGEPQETDEAIPLWIPLDRIPYDQMWADDSIWFPLMLEGKKFQEALAVLVTGLTHERLTFEGQHYQSNDVPMELRPLQRALPMGPGTARSPSCGMPTTTTPPMASRNHPLRLAGARARTAGAATGGERLQLRDLRVCLGHFDLAPVRRWGDARLPGSAAPVA